MAVGIENESRKIIWTVFGMKPDSSIIASVMFKRRPIEGGYRLLRGRAKGNMETLTWHDYPLRTKPDGKLIVGSGSAIADGCFLVTSASFMSPGPDITKRSKDCVVKDSRTHEISDGKGEMVEHLHIELSLTRPR